MLQSLSMARACLIALAAWRLAAVAEAPHTLARQIHGDDFAHGLGQWRAKLEKGGAVLIQYDATADYNLLRTYYVGQGGNSNITTRFRRYIGDAERRPLLPGHDLHDLAVLLQPNVRQTIQLVAMGHRIQDAAGGRLIFDFADPAPPTHGRFGLRTTRSYLEIHHFQVWSIAPKPARAGP